jgi:pilus assembly protein CpaC
MLKVRFAEMQRSVSKELSGSLGFIGSDALGGANNIDGVNDVITIPRTVTTQKTGALGIGFNAGGVEFGILLEALESKGMVRTLAEPNLTALSGQEAEFLAGGEYPIPVVGDEGSITIEYKPFGVQLGFIPNVVDADVINLAITAAVSGVDEANSIQTNDAFSVNAFKRREAKTTVEMRDGDSFVIAGLLQDDFSDLNGQVPWLGDIPVLGALFRSAEYRREQSELVIIVTPHLVTPTRGEALALPTDRVRPPSEADLFLRGRTYSTSGAAAEVARQDFTGSYGYVME